MSGDGKEPFSSMGGPDFIAACGKIPVPLKILNRCLLSKIKAKAFCRQ